MTNQVDHSKNNHTQRLFKILGCISGAVVLMFVSLVVWTANTISDLDIAVAKIKVRQSADSVLVQTHKLWISDWHDVLKVPERDQAQDSGIEDLTRRVDEIERRMR